MDEYMNDVKELCEIVAANLHEIKEYLKESGCIIYPEDAEMLDYLTHTQKSLSLLKKEPMENGEGLKAFSRRLGDAGGNYGRTYGDMDGGSYGRRMRSRTTGRYMDGYGRYRDDGSAQITDHLRRALENTQDQEQRRVLEDAMKRLENL